VTRSATLPPPREHRAEPEYTIQQAAGLTGQLLAQGASAAPLQHEMLVAQREVLQERLRELEDHLRYLDRKIDYWQAVRDGGAAPPPREHSPRDS
jgi:hypothetical protein